MIILGSGASLPYIRNDMFELSTKYLTKEIYDICSWKNVIEKYNIARSIYSKHETPNLDQNSIELNSIYEMLKIVKNCLENAKFSTKIKINNFEFAIHMIDRLSDTIGFCEFPEEIALDGKFIYHFGREQLKRIFLSDMDTDGWLYVPFLAREVIISAIIELWNNSKSIEKSVSKIRDFFDFMKEFGRTSIYTFNYDPLIVEALKQSDDFTFSFDSKGFQSSEFLNTQKNIVSFLHGSVCFVPQNESNKVIFNLDFNSAQKQRFSNLFLYTNKQTRIQTSGMKGQHFNTYLVTGLDKFEAFYSDPFSTYLTRLLYDLQESDYIIILGYGMNDEHINAFLSNSLSINPKKKFLFVTYMKEKEFKKNINDINSETPFSIPWNGNLIWKIHTVLDHNLTMIDKGEHRKTLVSHFKKLTEDIISKGFCWIADNVLLFIGGTNEFFRKKNELFDELYKGRN